MHRGALVNGMLLPIRAACRLAPVHATSGRIAKATSLFRFDAGRLDDWPPFLDLGPVEGSKRLRRLLLARKDPLTEAREPRPHRWIAQRFDDSAVELGDRLLGCASGYPKPVPKRQIEARPAGFVDGRN